MQIHPVLSAKLSHTDTDRLPVILYCSKSISAVRGSIAENYGKIKYELPFINAVSLDIPRHTINRLAKANTVRLITDDALVAKAPAAQKRKDSLRGHSHVHLNEENISAAYSGRRGKGVGIAIVDTGVSPHFDLMKPVSRIRAFKDLINGETRPYDDDGHGTHVAGVALGNGFSSSKYMGAAPLADLIAVKALDNTGNGITSNILAAIQWVINQRKR